MSDDLTGLVQLLMRRSATRSGQLDELGRRLGPLRSALNRAKAPTPEVDRANVAAHYDLPGELFACMLDETMTYSCALFPRPGASLAEAQRAKLDRICQKLQLGADDHVVEIGTGWGAFAIHAARNYGCSVTTTTISAAQQAEARRRVTAAGLQGPGHGPRQ